MRSGVFHVPVRTISESNQREHWRGRSTRHKHQREVGRVVMKAWMELHGIHTHPSAVNRNRVVRAVSLFRVANARLDHGNLAVSLKAVQDGLCDALGINDGDVEIAWNYDQVCGAPQAEFGVLVELRFDAFRRKK